jgi:hypothetical protein
MREPMMTVRDINETIPRTLVFDTATGCGSCGLKAV